jgi:hypothetical protein
MKGVYDGNVRVGVASRSLQVLPVMLYYRLTWIFNKVSQIPRFPLHRD